MNCFFSICNFVSFTTAAAINMSWAGERSNSLKAALKGADRVVVEDIGTDNDPFSFEGTEKIATLIAALDFDDEESGLHCMCLGDAYVTFFKGENELASLSHHHGQSLRWHRGKWDEDSLFTPKTAVVWRTWFNENGEARFENDYQAELKEQQRELTVDEYFMKAFPPEADAIFNDYAESEWPNFIAGAISESNRDALSPRTKKLISLFPNGKGLGHALARSLGGLAMVGAPTGSWTVSTSREQLVIECAKTLTLEQLRELIKSDDEEVLTGLARLFFFQGLSGLVPKNEGDPYAAKLCRAVLKHDKGGNTDLALRQMDRFPCKETFSLLEELANGEIKPAESFNSFKDEPNPITSACLILAKFGSEKAPHIIEAIETDNLDEFDQSALLIARSFCGERGLLASSIFEIDSYTIGFNALAALEKEGGKAALESIIMGGTTHTWAAIREEAVLTTERITGKKWFQDQGGERAEHHGAEIREWWTENRRSYEAK